MDIGIGSQWLLPVAKVDIGGKILFDRGFVKSGFHINVYKSTLTFLRNCHWVKIWFDVVDNVIRFWIDKHVSADKIRANVSEDVFFNLGSFLSMHLNSPFKCPHCGSIYLKRSRHLFQMQRYYSNFKWPDIESFELVE